MTVINVIPFESSPAKSSVHFPRSLARSIKSPAIKLQCSFCEFARGKNTERTKAQQQQCNAMKCTCCTRRRWWKYRANFDDSARPDGQSTKRKSNPLFYTRFDWAGDLRNFNALLDDSPSDDRPRKIAPYHPPSCPPQCT